MRSRLACQPTTRPASLEKCGGWLACCADAVARAGENVAAGPRCWKAVALAGLGLATLVASTGRGLRCWQFLAGRAPAPGRSAARGRRDATARTLREVVSVGAVSPCAARGSRTVNLATRVLAARRGGMALGQGDLLFQGRQYGADHRAGSPCFGSRIPPPSPAAKSNRDDRHWQVPSAHHPPAFTPLPVRICRACALGLAPALEARCSARQQLSATSTAIVLRPAVAALPEPLPEIAPADRV